MNIPSRMNVLIGLLVLSFVSLLSHADIPRLPNGKPDLSGRYNISTRTPYTRPTDFGDRAYLTKEEARAIEEKTRAARARGATKSDPDRSAPKGGNIGAYNDFFFEWGDTAFKIDGKYRTSIIVEPKNGQLPPVTEYGKRRWQTSTKYEWPNERTGSKNGTAWWMETGDEPYNGPESRNLGDRCIMTGVATYAIMSLPYNNVKTIVQTDDHMMLNIEWMHFTRVFRMNDEHRPQDIMSLAGDSIGWWEGDTAVIESTNFMMERSQPMEGYRLIEKFTPTKGGLVYYFRVEDPGYETPYAGEMFWPRSDDYNYEFACHEGNYYMGNMLRGARLLEREWISEQAVGAGE